MSIHIWFETLTGGLFCPPAYCMSKTGQGQIVKYAWVYAKNTP